MTQIIRSAPGKRASILSLTVFLLAYAGVLLVVLNPRTVAAPGAPVQAGALR